MVKVDPTKRERLFFLVANRECECDKEMPTIGREKQRKMEAFLSCKEPA